MFQLKEVIIYLLFFYTLKNEIIIKNYSYIKLKNKIFFDKKILFFTSFYSICWLCGNETWSWRSASPKSWIWLLSSWKKLLCRRKTRTYDWIIIRYIWWIPYRKHAKINVFLHKSLDLLLRIKFINHYMNEYLIYWDIYIDNLSLFAKILIRLRK